ncbi:MAG: GDP-mannose 4,6-dehydratase, partial [Patescibacteria group bacterium]
MNHPLKKLQQEALLLKLSSTEKAALHATLMNAVHASDTAGDASTPRSTPSPFYFFSPPSAAASKAASDCLARSYFHTYGFPVMVTHCSNNYGPHQFPEKLIPRIITEALA